jgi:hypothetical protein
MVWFGKEINTAERASEHGPVAVVLMVVRNGCRDGNRYRKQVG